MSNSITNITSCFLLLISCVSSTYAETHTFDLNTVDEYLIDSEQQFTDITPLTEKIIVWADQNKTKTNFAIVYVHGFSASRQETMPLSQLLADQLQANVFYTRLSGHGRSGDAMATASVEKWLADITEAWDIGKLLGDKVIFISVSTGGTLSTWLSAQDFAKDLYAQIMISPNFDIANKFAHILTWPLGLEFSKLIMGDERSFEPSSEAQGLYWSTRYPIEAAQHLVELVNYVEAVDKRSITAPTLMIFSPHDQVIDPDAIKKTFAEFGSTQKRMVEYLNSTDAHQHVLAGDIASPSSTSEILEIIMAFMHSLHPNNID